MLIFKKYFKNFKMTFYYFNLSLILSSILIFKFKYEILYFITKPFLSLKFNFSEIILTNITEPLIYYVTLTIFLTFFLNIPLFLLHLYLNNIKFFSDYKIKKNKYWLWIIYTIIFNLLFIFYLLPLIVNYFLNFQITQENYPLILKLNLKLANYILIYIKIIIYFNLFLNLPLILQKTNKWIKLKKYIYLLTIIIIAILTPPDLLSLIFIISPIIILLEFIHILINIRKYYEI